jgi:predicted PurR-regulated permease PerM
VTSRLDATTRPLAERVVLVLRRLGIEKVGSPTTAALIALYVVGLILLDGRQTQTRVARFLPGRCHDALNRLLRLMPLSTRALMGLLIGWVKTRRKAGYLCLDDCVLEKAFAKKLPWAG